MAAEQAGALEKGIDGAWRKRIEQGDPFEKLLQKEKARSTTHLCRHAKAGSLAAVAHDRAAQSSTLWCSAQSFRCCRVWMFCFTFMSGTDTSASCKALLRIFTYAAH